MYAGLIDVTRLNDSLELVIVVGSALAVVAGWWRWVRPRWRAFRSKTTAALDSLVGRPAVVDTITGEERIPALPGIGVRMDMQEKQMASLTDTVATLAKVVEHQSRLDGISEDHEKRITALEAARVEQALARKESTAAYRAIEAAAKGGADVTVDDVVSDPELGE
jgi:hypothetical protein